MDPDPQGSGAASAELLPWVVLWMPVEAGSLPVFLEVGRRSAGQGVPDVGGVWGSCRGVIGASNVDACPFFWSVFNPSPSSVALTDAYVCLVLLCSPYELPPHRALLDDSPEYGLRGYQLHVDLHSGGAFYLCSTFCNLFTNTGDNEFAFQFQMSELRTDLLPGHFAIDGLFVLPDPCVILGLVRPSTGPVLSPALSPAWSLSSAV